MEIVVPQEGENVSLESGGIFCRPCHVGVYNYFEIVLDRRHSHAG
jgi:hypothetical protein